MSKTNILLALLMSVIFGLGWILGKSALEQFPPILMAALRFGIAALIICAVWGWPSTKLRYLLPLSALAVSGPYSLSNIGLAQLDVSLTILLVQLEAPILILMSALFLKERPSRNALFGIFLAVLGVILVAGTPAAEGGAVWIGLVLFSILIWATGQLWIRKTGISGSVSLLGALAALATPQLFLLSALLEPNALSALAGVSPVAWAQVLYLGAVMTALGIGIWYYLLARFEVAFVAPYLLLVPAISIAGGVLFLGEEVTVWRLTGAAVITSGVALATVPFKRYARRTTKSSA